LLTNNNKPHFRKDPVSGTWVIVSAERGDRPSAWINEREEDGINKCPFCPGNEKQTPPEVYSLRRNESMPNSPGWSIRVVPNKFPALKNFGPIEYSDTNLFESFSGEGFHEVIIETPYHDKRLVDLEIENIRKIFQVYKERIVNLKKSKQVQYVLVFKNQGKSAGASIPHAHSQVIATPILPKQIEDEVSGMENYFEETKRCVLCDMMKEEFKNSSRLVTSNNDFCVLEPFASRFPFETWIVPLKHQPFFEDIKEDEIFNLSRIFTATLKKIDKILSKPAYNFVIHTSPLRLKRKATFHWHIELIPKVTHVAGFERGAGFFINPVLPEKAAAMLKED